MLIYIFIDSYISFIIFIYFHLRRRVYFIRFLHLIILADASSLASHASYPLAFSPKAEAFDYYIAVSTYFLRYDYFHTVGVI